MRACCLFFMSVALALGCVKVENKPNYCLGDSDCPLGACDTADKVCVVRDAAAADTAAATDAPANKGDAPTAPQSDGRQDPDAGSAPGDAALPSASDTATDSVRTPDTRAPDAAFSCATNNDCPSPGLRFCVATQCVECNGPQVCPEERPLCSANGKCLRCDLATATNCASRDTKRPLCLPATGRCAECATSAECKDPRLPLCSAAGACVACQATAAAVDGCGKKAAKAPVCDATTGECVECTASRDCGEVGKPICLGQKCGACTSDAQCVAKLGANPGICMAHQDGRCATDAESVYVQRAAGCSSTGTVGGTAATPFCFSQTGIDAATATRRLVVMKGPGALTDFATNPSGFALSVVAQSGATVEPGAHVGLRVVGGEVFVRGLTINGGSDVGVVVDSGAVLRMNRCVIKDNKLGGLLVNAGGAFDVANTVFDGNGPGMAGPASFGGVFLGTPKITGPARFRNNTVLNSKLVAIVCEKATQPLSGLLLYQNLGGDIVNCAITTSKQTADGDPKLTADYHLTASSACRNAGDPTDFPADDLDGNSRPLEGRSDCGADEFGP